MKLKPNEDHLVTKADLVQSQDELAGIISRGFEELTGKVDLLDKKIDGVESKLETKIDVINDRLENVAYKFEVKDLQNRVIKLEQKQTAR